MKCLCATLSMLLLLTLPLVAQILPPSTINPIIDGSVGASEYLQVIPLKDMRLGYALSNNGKLLHFALEAPTSGWVSVGLDSKRMNGAHFIIGYDAMSTQVINEETGRGRSHSPSTVNILVESKIKELGGKTTLEFSVPASLYESGSELNIIVSYGNQDNIRSKHSRYDSHTIKFQQ
ncbi:MAG: hypothetical protein EOM67_05120 [Spirochaetia bacterium]|nr:hypothetical protein [Spirochaetia bacterium]